jgi:hypothetical protein
MGFPFLLALLAPPLFPAEDAGWQTFVDPVYHVHVEAAARLSGEPPTLLGVTLDEESGQDADAVRYCTRWTANPDGTRSCTAERSCYVNCRRAAVWRHRLDIGLWQLRSPPSTVLAEDGQTSVPIKGWSWLRWYRRLTRDRTIGPECALDPGCATKVFGAVVRHLKTDYPPKRCPGSKYPAALGAWIPHYVCGPSRDACGCRAREKRLDTARQWSAMAGPPER